MMTKFQDGPAASVTLSLRRAPKFLRVVRDAQGTWDALDQLSDGPRAREAIFAYRKVSDDGQVHLCVRGKNRGASGWYRLATYAVVAEQPAEATMRDMTAWRAWCLAQVTKPEGV